MHMQVNYIVIGPKLSCQVELIRLFVESDPYFVSISESQKISKRIELYETLYQKYVAPFKQSALLVRLFIGYNNFMSTESNNFPFEGSIFIILFDCQILA